MEYLQHLDTGILTVFRTFIFWLSHQSGLPTPQFFPHQDKLAHFSEYALLGFLVMRCFRHHIKRPDLLFLVSLGFCSLYGVLDVIHQYYIPGRTSDILDWLADTVGSGVSISLMTLAQLRNKQSHMS